MPHQGQRGRRVANDLMAGGAKDERHDAVAAAVQLACDSRRVRAPLPGCLSDALAMRRVRQCLLPQPLLRMFIRSVLWFLGAPAADVLLVYKGGRPAGGVAFDVAMRSVIKADGTAVLKPGRRQQAGDAFASGAVAARCRLSSEG